MLRSTKAEPADKGTASFADEGSAKTVDDDGLNGLARGALRGAPFALRRFLLAIAPLVRSVCRGVMGRESAKLEAAIQDCLIDVVCALPQFRLEADISHDVTKTSMRRRIASRERARARFTR
jgi:DNA-directed RNA polymerase specialized sigma24 family protein